jgi:serine/threonine-protein kinase
MEGRHINTHDLLLAEGFVAPRPLNSGWQATVYRAWDSQTRVDVAVKVLRAGRNGADRGRLINEGGVLTYLAGHEAIVRLVRTGELGDARPFLALEFCEQGSLDRLVRRYHGIGWRAAIRHGATAASALAFAHRNGVLHGDVKPANILLHQSGSSKLADFGIARLMSNPRLSVGVHGSPHFMAPELARETQAFLTPESDVYSCAATVIELAVGIRGDRSNTLHHLDLLRRRNELGNDWSLAAETLLSAVDRNPQRRPSASALATQMGAIC